MKEKRPVRIAAYDLSSDDTLAAAARKIISKQVARMKGHTAGTREGSDPEALHDMRVATRRLRFALRLFAPWMPPGRADRLRGELRRTALVLGRVRDLDVFLIELPGLAERAGLSRDQKDAVAGALRRKRGQGRAVLVRSLRSARHRRMARALERMPMTQGAAVPAGVEASRMIRKAGERVRDIAKSADFAKQEDLHRLRILFKRLRYTCEYFRDLHGPALDGAIAHFIRFQDCLGKYQDAVVASAILEGLAKKRKQEAGSLSGGEILSGHLEPKLGPSAGRKPEAWSQKSEAGSQKPENRTKNNNRQDSDFSDAIANLQQVLREKRGLQREEFSELWAGFPLMMRAFFKLLRHGPGAGPEQRDFRGAGAPS